MRTRIHSTIALGVGSLQLILLLSSCEVLATHSVGPDCQPTSASPLGWATLGYVGLFSADGRPIEIPNARVFCSQGSSTEVRATSHPDRTEGYVIVGERVTFVVGEGVVRNGFTCGTSISLRYCDAPLRVRVEAPGCAPYEMSWTWQENLRRNGARDISFYIPVLLQCTVDAGIQDVARDVPRSDTPQLESLDVP